MPIEYPTQDYYPSAKLKLSIRLDELGSSRQLAKTTDLIPTKNINGTSAIRSPLKPVKNPDGNGYLLLPDGVSPVDASPIDTSASTDGLTFDVVTIPKSASWNQNGSRAADQLEVVFKFIDCPLDARLIRACGVEFYLGSLTPEEFMAGIQGKNRPGGSAQQGAGEPLNVIADTYLDSNGQSRTNLRFKGWVDKWKVEKKGDSEAVVKLDCRDASQPLFDQESGPQHVIDMKRPIDEAIAFYLSSFPQFAGLTVMYLPNSATPPKLVDALQGTAYRPKLGPQPAKGGGSNTKLSVMDYIVDVCGAIGHIVRVVDAQVIIQTARSYTTKEIVRRAEDPFRGRTVNGQQFGYRRFIYGRNIKDLTIERRYGSNLPANIEVRCFLSDTEVSARDIESAYRRIYSGPVIRIFSQGRGVFAGTPNHPILTARGWIPLNEIADSDYLIGCDFTKRRGGGDPHVDAMPTKFCELFDTLADAWRTQRRTTRDVDFHGDGMDSDVEIVKSDSLLGDNPQPLPLEHSDEQFFLISYEAFVSLTAQSEHFAREGDLVRWTFAPPGGIETVRSESLLLLVAHLGETQLAGFFESPPGNLPSDQSFANIPVSLTDVSSDLVERCAGQITTHNIVRIERSQFSGHVYNLQTRSSWYCASGVVSHNCYNGENKTTLVARFPEPKDRVAYALPGNIKPHQKWIVKTVTGINDLKTLKVVAQTFYESLGRNELCIEIETHNLASWGGGATDPDILDMKAGDTFTLLMDASQDVQEVNSLTAIERQLLSVQKNAEYLKNLGFDPDAAKSYAKKFVDANFMTDFRLRSLRTSWSTEEGVSFQLEGVNYIEVRFDKMNSDGEPGDDNSSPNRGAIKQGGTAQSKNSSGSAPPKKQ